MLLLYCILYCINYIILFNIAILYDMILYYILLFYFTHTHTRLHSTIGCIFPSVGASRCVLARHGALDASFWRSVPLCRELQLARYKKSLQDGVDGVQRSKDGIWWHMMAYDGMVLRVTSPCLGHSFARGSMQTSMLIPRRPVFLIPHLPGEGC